MTYKERVESRLEGLEPAMKLKALMLVALAADQGVPLRVTYGRRTEAEQKALYAQGRLVLEETNRLRKQAGMDPIGWIENRKVVTDADGVLKLSNHQRGWAVDVVPLAWEDRLIPLWNSSRWNLIGEIGKSIGLAWGGDWRKPDRPHFEVV